MKVGMVGPDPSHVEAFTDLLNDPEPQSRRNPGTVRRSATNFFQFQHNMFNNPRRSS